MAKGRKTFDGIDCPTYIVVGLERVNIQGLGYGSHVLGRVKLVENRDKLIQC